MHDMVEKMLKENQLCVLCTESQGMPHCSLMTYILDEERKILYLITSMNSRKYKNLKENANVSVIIDSRQQLEVGSKHPITSVTFDGEFFEIENPLLEEMRAKFGARHPELGEILVQDSCVIFSVRLKNYLLLNGPVQTLQGEL
ncbi:MAG: hypothetical protein GT601_08735 [Acidaminobacter sp.]|uniref:pyridoxamine 5'-phosphate oxidase family protein n=1 Tax=Acidaminobacter sp. TaxID=1872102 RepID=UPI00137C8865|nr:pyridoxamine 5'-phosphate oxidase family protein [Acidaminobacter sp.]MZQ97751.1 hypothetical protein [Acidaminobacter sp.]